MLVLPIKNGIEDTPKIIMIPKRTKEIDLLEVADTGFQLLEEVSGGRAADPIESRDDINGIVEYCLNSQMWREALLFVVGINFGIRVSDLRRIQIKHMLKGDSFAETFTFVEGKTKHKKTVYLNDAVKEMLTIYLDHQDSIIPERFLFESKSRFMEYINDGDVDVPRPLTRQWIDKKVKQLAKAQGLVGQYSTHTLRKTPGFHILKMAPEYIGVENTVGVQLLQLFYGHASIQSTFHYTKFENYMIQDLFQRLNLGLEAILEFKKGRENSYE